MEEGTGSVIPVPRKRKARQFARGRQVDKGALGEVQALLAGETIVRDRLIEYLHLIHHRCCPQYRFRRPSYSDSNLCELFPFSYCTAFDTESWGGMPISRGTWSLLTEPA
jgi:hypothetical protein